MNIEFGISARACMRIGHRVPPLKLNRRVLRICFRPAVNKGEVLADNSKSKFDWRVVVVINFLVCSLPWFHVPGEDQRTSGGVEIQIPPGSLLSIPELPALRRYSKVYRQAD